MKFDNRLFVFVIILLFVGVSGWAMGRQAAAGPNQIDPAVTPDVFHYAPLVIDGRETLTPTLTPQPEDLPPLVNIVSFNPASGRAPLTVAFKGSAQPDYDSYITSYTWVLGNGATRSGADIAYTYTEGGTYEVYLRAEDNEGFVSNSETVTIFIEPPLWTPTPTGTHTPTPTMTVTPTPTMTPTVELVAPEIITLTADVTSGPRPLTVNFTAAVTDTDGTVDDISWDFGDDTITDTLDVTHVYVMTGTITATLTITDNDGLTATDDIVITVEEKPTESICPVLPIIIERGNRSLNASNFPAAGDFQYPAGGLTYNDFPDNVSDVPLENAQSGYVYFLKEGAQPGSFAWVRWNEGVNASEQNLIANMTWPGRNEDYSNSGAFGLAVAGSGYDYPLYGYIEPGDPTDQMLDLGDRVAGTTGLKNSTGGRSALQDWIENGRVLRILLFDVAEMTGSGGSNAQYMVYGSVLVKLHGYNLSSGGGSWLLIEFIEQDQLCG